MSKRPEVFSYQDEGDEETSRDRSRKLKLLVNQRQYFLTNIFILLWRKNKKRVKS